MEQFSEPGVLERCRSEGKKNGKVREDLPGKGVCETGINANFFTGVGTGCYCIVSRYGGFSHTTYIELFANTGILGSLIFIWAILNFLMTQLRRYKSTNDLLFLLFLIFGLFFAFDNFFYVFYSSVWLLGIFLLVAAHSDQHYYSNYS